MKKTLNARYWLLLLILIVSSNLIANDVVFVAGTDVSETKTITKDGITITLSNGTLSRTDNYRPYANSTTTVSSSVGNISKVVFTCTAEGSSAYGPAGFDRNNVSPGSYSYSGYDGKWTGDAASFSIKATSQVRVTKIVVTYTPKGTTEPDITYNGEESYQIEAGGDFTEPSFIISSEGVSLSYKSDNTAVASVDEATGEVSLNGVGQATITASFAGNATYASWTKSYTITVTAPSEVSLPYTESFSSSFGYFAADASSVWTHDNSYSCLKATSSEATEAWTTSPRIDLSEVKGAKLSFQHARNKNVDLTSLCGVYVKEEGGDWQQLEIATWPTNWTFVSSGEIDLVDYVGKKIQIGFKYSSTATAAGTWEIKNLKVEEAARVLTAPVFSPEGGTYKEAQTILINTEETASDVYLIYSTDGTDPDVADASTFTTYSGAIAVNKSNTTLKARATDGKSMSEVVSAVYVIKPTAPVITPDGAIYTESQEVTITQEDGLEIRYTTDGSEPTANSTNYEAAFSVTENVTVKAVAVDANGNLSDVVSAVFKNSAIQNETPSAMFCNEFFGYAAGTANQKDDTKFEGDADGVTIVVNKGTSTTKMYVSDEELRVYNGNSMSFTAPNGYDITKIVFTPSDWKGSVTPNLGTMTEKTWTGKSETVVFSIGASNRLTKAEITLAPGKQSAALKYAVDEYRTETESGEVTDAPELTKAEGYDGTITYTSSDETIAMVDGQTGIVTAVAVGDVTITATGTETTAYNGGTASYVLHIGYLDAQMKFAKDAVTVPIGGSVENTLTKKTSAEVVYASDNEAVASVDGSGNVTVKAVGSATITATAEKADPYKAGEASYTITVEDKKGSEFGSKSCFYEPFDYNGGTGGNDGQFKGNVASSNFVTNYSGTNNWTEISYLGFNCARAGTGSLKGTATVSSIAVEAGKTYHLNFKAAPFNEERTVMDVTVEGGTIDGQSTETMTNFQWNDLSATITATADELSLTFTADQNRFFLDEIRLADPEDLNTASVTIPASGWASYCCEYPIEFTDNGDVKAYAVTKVSGNKATLTQVTGTIKGGVPLFINGAAGEHPLTVAEHSTNEMDGNLLKGTLSPTYVAGETSEAINYGLKSGELHAIVSGTMPAGKAYLPIAKSVAAGSKITFIFDTTGINHYQSNQADGIFYDLQGRRVVNPQKGIYVRNGKKVVIK